MIPTFDSKPGEDGRLHLPAGMHRATWDEFAERFGNNHRRREILAGLLRALQALRAAGCRRAWIDGSFITSKELPGDFDGCWDHTDVDFDKLDPVLFDFQGHREAQKTKFGGEMFPATVPADAIGTLFLDFFQLDRDGGQKGIVQIDLENLP